MKNVQKPFAKSVLIQLELTGAASANQRNIFGSGITTLIISNEEMNDIMEIVKSLEEFCLLIKDVRGTIRATQDI